MKAEEVGGRKKSEGARERESDTGTARQNERARERGSEEARARERESEEERQTATKRGSVGCDNTFPARASAHNSSALARPPDRVESGYKARYSSLKHKMKALIYVRCACLKFAAFATTFLSFYASPFFSRLLLCLLGTRGPARGPRSIARPRGSSCYGARVGGSLFLIVASRTKIRSHTRSHTIRRHYETL